jgi:hypothetical protein
MRPRNQERAGSSSLNLCHCISISMGGISKGTLTILRSYGFEYISAWRRWQVRIRSVPWTKLKSHPEIGNDHLDLPNVAAMLQEPFVVGRYPPIAQIHPDVPQAFVLLKRADLLSPFNVFDIGAPSMASITRRAERALLPVLAMVTSPQAPASSAGVDILRAGALRLTPRSRSAVLAVVYRHMPGLGGYVCLIHEGSSGAGEFLNGVVEHSQAGKP